MTHLMARDKLEEQLPRILAGILGLYRRHSEPFHVTQVKALCFQNFRNKYTSEKLFQAVDSIVRKQKFIIVHSLNLQLDIA